MDSLEPLSDAEIDELDRFLTSEDMPEESMDVSMLDGFLTALVIGPNLLMPSQWLPHVWGETEEDPMTWQSQKQAARMTSLVFRHMNDIIWCLTNDPDHYEPLIFEHNFKGETVPVIDEWCMGFIMGTTLDADAWAPLLESDEHEDFLLPILLYGTQDGWDQLQEQPELAARHEAFAAALADSVLAIRDHWLPLRKAKSTIRHAEPLPGRNDSCPCGSGKKFKKCCGDPARMH